MSDVPSRLIDAVPYLDGSGRRRLVVGVLFLTGLVAANLSAVGEWARGLLGGIGLLDLVKSPILVGVVLVLAYAIGNFIELLGDIVIAPFACGVLGAIETAWVGSKWWMLPVSIPVGALKGLVGRGRLQLDLSKSLSRRAQERFDREPLPESVVEGLKYPLERHSELAFKYVTDSFEVERSRSWAKQTITRLKDVSALITVAVIVVAIVGIPRIVGVLTAEQRREEFNEPARQYLGQIRQAVKTINEQREKADIKRCGSVCRSVKHVEDIARQFVLGEAGVDVFAANLQNGIEELGSLNQRSRDLQATVIDMNARWKGDLGSESMQHDEQLCREIAAIGRDLWRALLATPSAKGEGSPTPIVDVPVEGLRSRLNEIEPNTACPTQWWRLIDDINHLARFLDPVEPAVIDSITKQGENLIRSIRTEPKGSHWRALARLILLYVLPASMPLILFYLVLVRSLRTRLTNMLEALAIERDEIEVGHMGDVPK